MAMFYEVINILCDHLCLRDVFKVWEAIGGWKRIWQTDTVAALCRRMELRHNDSCTMETLCKKMNNTCRCGMCGKRTRSRAFHGLQPLFLCTECRDQYLVSRVQVKDILRSCKALKHVSMTPWKNGRLLVAKRGRTGAYLYWRSDVQYLLQSPK